MMCVLVLRYLVVISGEVPMWCGWIWWDSWRIDSSVWFI